MENYITKSVIYLITNIFTKLSSRKKREKGLNYVFFLKWGSGNKIRKDTKILSLE